MLHCMLIDIVQHSLCLSQRSMLLLCSACKLLGCLQVGQQACTIVMASAKCRRCGHIVLRRERRESVDDLVINST